MSEYEHPYNPLLSVEAGQLEVLGYTWAQGTAAPGGWREGGPGAWPLSWPDWSTLEHIGLI